MKLFLLQAVIVATFLVGPLSGLNSVAAAAGPYASGYKKTYAAPSLPGATAPYSFAGHEQSLNEALNYFAKNTGIAITIGESVKDISSIQIPTVLDRLDYINFLAAKYSLSWFYDGATLYVDSVNALEQKVFSLQKANGAVIIEILRRLDLYQPKFMHRYDRQHRVLMVAGPPAYIGLVENTVKAEEAANRTETTILRGAGSSTGLPGLEDNKSFSSPTSDFSTPGTTLPGVTDMDATTSQTGF